VNRTRRGGRDASPSACRGAAFGRTVAVGLALAAALGAPACTGRSVTLSSPRAAAHPVAASGAVDRRASLAAPSPHATGSPAPAIRRDLVKAPWAEAIDRVLAGYDVSVAIGAGDRILYEHRGDRLRTLASNEKLLTSMALLAAFGPDHRLGTAAMAAAAPSNGVVHGNLWLVGGGDPGIDAARLDTLARRVRGAGVSRITGSIVGDTSAFDRGWWAPGWLRGVSRGYVTRPTALAFDGNAGSAVPEAAAAAALRGSLVAAGVEVGGSIASRPAPDGLRTIGTIASAPLGTLLEQQNHDSVNFIAEMLTKALGEASLGTGSTATGARAIESWVAGQGVDATVRDGSGLSDEDRTSAMGMVALLLEAEREPWFPALRASLPAPGEGTLGGRLTGIPVRAKTGTLFVRPASCLSGYVRARDGTMLAFAILSRGLPSGTAQPIEDAVVRIAADVASVPSR
jgi:serine-type D-Ala-D-Ala carboxypeptidase/endopeptidase (penicillin-binding protein 4)